MNKLGLYRSDIQFTILLEPVYLSMYREMKQLISYVSFLPKCISIKVIKKYTYKGKTDNFCI